MNWFTKLFRKQPIQPSATQLSSIKAQQADADSGKQPETTQPSRVLKQNLTVEQLKKFAPLRDLADSDIAALSHATLRYPEGATIVTIGQRCDSVFYLLEGRISMEPDGDNSYEVIADTPLSFLPLNSSNHSGATARALTGVSILEVSVELNRLWANKSHENTSCIELVDIQLPAEISDNRFFNSFACAYRENRLRLPSLPDVAFKLKEALQQDVGINKAVEIIHIDPPIVTKLIQVANSALYTTGSPITNCHDAVARIGLDATRNLVMGISLKQLFNCKDPALMKGMHMLWHNSLYVSSLCFVLAQECSRINPEDALLAGLIADIGAIPLLHFAEQFPDEYPSFDELQASLTYLRAPVGALVLHTLGFSEQLSNIPHHAENWLYDSGPELTLEDIVILAKLHSYFGTGKAHDLPYINSIPAYGKLSNGKLDPDFSLSILKKAQHRIHEAMQLLS
ncbi:MAG: HDOD domain-containing protein [Methylomonas sp.]